MNILGTITNVEHALLNGTPSPGKINISIRWVADDGTGQGTEAITLDTASSPASTLKAKLTLAFRERMMDLFGSSPSGVILLN